MMWNRKTIFLCSFALCGFFCGVGPALPACAAGVKAQKTPYFWQFDPQGRFGSQAGYYCGPAALASGLVYLARERGKQGLVASTNPSNQGALISDLAHKMEIKQRGTYLSEMITGLMRYSQARGYRVTNLEIATGVRLDAAYQKYRVRRKPQLHAMIVAAKDPDVVELVSFGWYKKGKDGRYRRDGGHWLNVVGPGQLPWQFEVRNPALDPRLQKSANVLTLSLVEKNFTYADREGGEWNLSGYYQGKGAGMSSGRQNEPTAVLESVILFKLAK